MWIGRIRMGDVRSPNGNHIRADTLSTARIKFVWKPGGWAKWSQRQWATTKMELVQSKLSQSALLVFRLTTANAFHNQNIIYQRVKWSACVGYTNVAALGRIFGGGMRSPSSSVAMGEIYVTSWHRPRAALQMQSATFSVDPNGRTKKKLLHIFHLLVRRLRTPKLT